MEQCSTTNAIHKVCSNLSIFRRLLFGPTSVTGTRSKTRLRRDYQGDFEPVREAFVRDLLRILHWVF